MAVAERYQTGFLAAKAYLFSVPNKYQLFTNCNLLAHDANKTIYWVNRDAKKIEDPFPLVFASEDESTESSLSSD